MRAVVTGATGCIGRVLCRELTARGTTPGLAVVLVGENPASLSYVRSKNKAAHEIGMHSEQHDLPVDKRLVGLQDVRLPALRFGRSARTAIAAGVTGAAGVRFCRLVLRKGFLDN